MHLETVIQLPVIKLLQEIATGITMPMAPITTKIRMGVHTTVVLQRTGLLPADKCIYPSQKWLNNVDNPFVVWAL